VPSVGISYNLALDGMGLVLVLLTAIILFAGVFASWTVKTRGQEFYALLLLLVTGVFGVFVSLDLFVFFLFYEIAVLPMYLLIGIWGSSGEVRPQGIFGWAFKRTGVGTKEYAAMKLTLYLLLGSAFILVGILAPLHGRRIDELLVRRPAEGAVLPAAPVVGVPRVLRRLRDPRRHLAAHTWSPDGHASAPTAVSMLHAGVLMKLGAYGVVRLGLGPHAGGAIEWAWLVGAIACINIVYGALSAMAQTDLKYVVAYSSVSHMGIVMLGIATLNEQGLNGAVFQMVAHGIMTGLFFALVGLVYEKAHSRAIFTMGGFAQMMPGIATAFAVGGFSSLGLPATAGFVAEFLTVVGAWASKHPWWLFPASSAPSSRRSTCCASSANLLGAEEHRPPLPGSARRAGHRMGRARVPRLLLVLFGVVPSLIVGPIDTATVPLLVRMGRDAMSGGALSLTDRSASSSPSAA
jgi:NADH-quinone oxidoreductase subunit M